LLLLVEGGWSTLWAAACDEEWLDALHVWRTWQAGAPAQALPYTLPGAPGGQAARWLGQWRVWWREVLWPAHGPAVASLALGAALALLVAAALGPRLLLLSLGAIAVVQLAFLFSAGGGEASRGAQGLVQIGLPWMAGILAFGGAGGPSLLAVLWGLCFTAAYAGLLYVSQAGQAAVESSGRSAVTVGTVLLLLGPLTAVGLLAVTFHPLPAMAGGLLVCALALPLPWRGRGWSGAQVARHAQWPLMALMVIAAIAIGIS
jgi:hypothetical protein